MLKTRLLRTGCANGGHCVTFMTIEWVNVSGNNTKWVAHRASEKISIRLLHIVAVQLQHVEQTVLRGGKVEFPAVWEALPSKAIIQFLSFTPICLLTPCWLFILRSLLVAVLNFRPRRMRGGYESRTMRVRSYERTNYLRDLMWEILERTWDEHDGGVTTNASVVISALARRAMRALLNIGMAFWCWQSVGGSAVIGGCVIIGFWDDCEWLSAMSAGASEPVGCHSCDVREIAILNLTLWLRWKTLILMMLAAVWLLGIGASALSETGEYWLGLRSILFRRPSLITYWWVFSRGEMRICFLLLKKL